MSADAFFRMGAHHKVCQDYADSGIWAGRPYAMVSDGCSSSPDTDFGARFLTLAATRRLGRLVDGLIEARDVIVDAESMARAVGIGQRSLDATLLCAIGGGWGCRVVQSGDGVIAARRRDGSFVYYETSFDQGAPYYLSYLLDNGALAAYRRLVGSMTITQREFLPDLGGWQPAESNTIPSAEFDAWRSFSFAARTFDVVLLLSDGCQSFFSGVETVPLESVLEQVLALKGLSGEFVTRRCNAFLQRYCHERGWKHGDDFSVAGIHLEEAP